jgi:hypothetical protein
MADAAAEEVAKLAVDGAPEGGAKAPGKARARGARAASASLLHPCSLANARRARTPLACRPMRRCRRHHAALLRRLAAICARQRVHPPVGAQP